jgi:wobble nucleotide-excising tRNase
MISRFTLIKGIGRYIDCRDLGGRQFNKNTIIFGPNTGGKSTLTDILWSYKTGDSSFIEGRRTFGHNGNQEVEFYNELNEARRYPGALWNNGFGNIEIFDTQFINDNIFEGSEVTFDHQKNLHKIIVGSKGKQLATAINELQEEMNELINKKRTSTTEFNRVFKNEITAQDFKRLPKFENPDELISQIRSAIEIATNQAKIENVFTSIDSHLGNVINQNTRLVLSRSIEVKAELITGHIERTWKDTAHSKDFLQTGFNLTKHGHEDCVFCGQVLSQSSKDLLAAYSKVFSDEYRSLQKEISESIFKFAKWDPITFFDSIKDKLSSINLSLSPDIDSKKHEMSELKVAIDSEFDNKLRDIAYAVEFDKYDQLIQQFREMALEIATLKANCILSGNVDILGLQKKIIEIERSKLRHSKEWDQFLNEYDSTDVKQESIKKQRDNLRIDLLKYSERLFSIHLDTINKVLQELNADFVICDFQPIRKLVGQGERIFALKFFHQHQVNIDVIAKGKPNFNNTLSDSDKRVLSFAFFYSLLIHDSDLHNKIIVFDDPFSSFDKERRTKTAELLANPYLISEHGEMIQKSYKQLIILTHEEEFFKWIFRKLDSPKAFRIIPDGYHNNVKKSTLADCNVYREFIEDESIRHLREVEELYMANKIIVNYEGLCSKCRVILEMLFKRKYLFDLDAEITGNKASIRTFISRLKELKISDFDNEVKYRRFIMLCDNLNIELHDNSLKNEGGNARGVLGDFLQLVKLV